MGRILLLLSLVALVVLLLGTSFAPQNPDFWLASNASIYQHIREGLALVLGLQLVTRPPRRMWFRFLTGAIAMSVGIWSIEATYANNMPSLDTLAFLGSSFAIGAAALERRVTAPRIVMPSKKIVVV